jgi:hypothetical protein
MKKNVVLGAAVNLTKENIQNFVKSFRKYNSNDDLILIIKPEHEIYLEDFLKDYDVNIIFFEKNSFLNMSLMNSRFFIYQEFLLKNESTYKNVLLSDVSDVVFQADPFKDLENEFIYFFEEDSFETIGTNKYNSAWILEVFGPDDLNELKDNTIICAGTTLGSFTNILNYLNHLLKRIIEFQMFKKGEYLKNIDQGVHNHLVYKKIHLFSNPKIKPNGELVCTLSLALKNTDNLIEIKENMLFFNNSKPAIIHQYNRSEKIKNVFDELYC